MYPFSVILSFAGSPGLVPEWCWLRATERVPTTDPSPGPSLPTAAAAGREGPGEGYAVPRREW